MRFFKRNIDFAILKNIPISPWFDKNKRHIAIGCFFLIIVISSILYFQQATNEQAYLKTETIRAKMIENYVDWSGLGKIIATVPSGEKWTSIGANSGPQVVNQKTGILVPYNTVWTITTPGGNNKNSAWASAICNAGGFFNCTYSTTNIVARYVSSLPQNIGVVSASAPIIAVPVLHQAVGISTSSAQGAIGLYSHSETLYFKNTDTNKQVAIVKSLFMSADNFISAKIYSNPEPTWGITLYWYTKY